jgi:hypothetical protein
MYNVYWYFVCDEQLILVLDDKVILIVYLYIIWTNIDYIIVDRAMYS